MNEFFKFVIRFFRGRRRKIGLFTLMLVVLLTVGWIRSSRYRDQLILPFGDFDSVGVISFERSLLLGKHHDERFKSRMTLPAFGSGELWGPGYVSFFNHDSGVNWCWQLYGFGVGELRHEATPDQLTFWIAPYWSIVFPLTLISAWFLISKPRQLTQKKIKEPVPDTGA